MAYEHHCGPLEPAEIERLNEGAAPEPMVVKALPMTVPEVALQHDAEKKRIKKGILGGSEEHRVF